VKEVSSSCFSKQVTCVTAMQYINISLFRRWSAFAFPVFSLCSSCLRLDKTARQSHSRYRV